MALVTLVTQKIGQERTLTEAIKAAYREARRQNPLEADSWLRVSSIGSICEREEVLCSLHNVVREDVIDGDAGVNFAHGHAVHWMFQSRILPQVGVLIGSWRCTYCGEQYGSRKTILVPRPDRCMRCGAIAGERPRPNGRPDSDVNDNAFVFVEEWIGNERYKIGGSPDGQIIDNYYPDYRLEDVTLIELKSSNDRNFQKYKHTPDFVHAIQTNIYMFLTGYQRAKIIYFNKNFTKNDKGIPPIWEHDIERDQELIDRVLGAIDKIRNGIESKSVPPRTVCATDDCIRAKGCKVRGLCFQ